MNKTNIVVLVVVALVALFFVSQYLNPEESLGVDQPQTVSGEEVQEILLVEALEQNITITERELESAYLGLQNKSEMSQEEYDVYILEQYEDRAAYDKNLEDNLKVLKLINDQINWSRINIEDEAIDVFIAQNPEIFPQDQLNDPMFKENLYAIARKQMFETQRKQLIDEYVASVVEKHTA